MLVKLCSNQQITISSDILRQYSARNNANPKKWIVSEIEDGGWNYSLFL